MKGLKRAASVWIWVDAMVKLAGMLALFGALAYGWYAITHTPELLRF